MGKFDKTFQVNFISVYDNFLFLFYNFVKTKNVNMEVDILEVETKQRRGTEISKALFKELPKWLLQIVISILLQIQK